MKIFKVKKVFEIAYAHRLFKYNGKCENLHGHNAKIEITLQSKNLDSQTMVKDFTQIKKIAGKWLDDNLDHATLLHKKDPLAKILKQLN
ncbi:MAG: 6-pyruvoyl trahydropterin synthase family protein, partial [Elusimicrobiales bacterium]